MITKSSDAATQATDRWHRIVVYQPKGQDHYWLCPSCWDVDKVDPAPDRLILEVSDLYLTREAACARCGTRPA